MASAPAESLRPIAVLRIRREFLTVQRQARRLGGRLLALWSSPHAAGHLPRVGLTVSRRVGNAVCRNRVRRRLKEIFRCHPQWLEAARDYVVVAQPAAAGAASRQLAEDLQQLLQRAHRVAGRPR